MDVTLGRLVTPATRHHEVPPGRSLEPIPQWSIGPQLRHRHGSPGPDAAKGVILVTIEDESGTMNVICWPNLVEQQRRELMVAKLLGVYGVWQCERNVRHLVAKEACGPEPHAREAVH